MPIKKSSKIDSIFLILGHGVPKDILKDENYNLYLKSVFNKIYDLKIQNKITNPIIICSGGKTDCFKPYKRNEADEMIKFLKKISKKSFLKKIIQDWVFIGERKSLSTLENLLNCKSIVQKKKIKKANFYIFCEQTREKRIKILARKILNKNYKFLIIPIDFDTSLNRYIDPKFLAKKEQVELKHALGALQNSENLKKHHKLFEEKIEFLRKQGPKMHAEAVKKWWEKKLKQYSTGTSL